MLKSSWGQLGWLCWATKLALQQRMPNDPSIAFLNPQETSSCSLQAYLSLEQHASKGRIVLSAGGWCCLTLPLNPHDESQKPLLIFLCRFP
jgi:hypothetical protein